MLKENLVYTLLHKKAFLKVEKELLGKNTLRGFLHDVDKLFLYFFFSKKRTHKIHRSYARHHIVNAKTRNDYIEMVIDWESSRFTKPKSQLNAYETLINKHMEVYSSVYPILIDLKLV